MTIKKLTRVSKAIPNRIHKEFNDLFSGIGCFEGKFSLQEKEGSCLNQVQPGRVAYELQKALRGELEQLQKQQILAPLSVDETSEWYNSFALVPKVNGKVRLCLDPAQLNKALIRPIQRGPTINDILPKLIGIKPHTDRSQHWILYSKM